jgi:hypothetical protein
MKVLLFGAGGHIGSVVTSELLGRGHEVTAVTRTGSVDGADRPGLTVRSGDARDAATVAELSAGHDAVASTIGPRIGQEDDREIIVGATRGLVDGLRKSGVRRLVVLGGAGSLRNPAGEILVETPGFPQQWKANALAQSAALGIYREVQDLDWTFVSPASLIEPGERTGQFRVGGDDLLTDAEGRSRVSIEDFAVAFVDQIEKGDAVRTRISVAY